MTPRVWITRAEPGASATAGRLQAIGFAPLVAPLLTVEPVDTPLDLNGVGSIAFTSTNAVKAFAARTGRRDLPAFTVGDATAKAAHAAGFSQVASADGDMAALIRLLATARPEGVVLHPCGRHKAGDFQGGLKRVGLNGRDVELYDTPAVPVLPADAAAALAEHEVAAVLLHSSRAAEILAGFAGGQDLSEILALGFSSACLRPLGGLGFADLLKADRPTESALLDALLVALGKDRERR